MPQGATLHVEYSGSLKGHIGNTRHLATQTVNAAYAVCMDVPDRKGFKEKKAQTFFVKMMRSKPEIAVCHLNKHFEVEDSNKLEV